MSLDEIFDLIAWVYFHFLYDVVRSSNDAILQLIYFPVDTLLIKRKYELKRWILVGMDEVLDVCRT